MKNFPKGQTDVFMYAHSHTFLNTQFVFYIHYRDRPALDLKEGGKRERNRGWERERKEEGSKEKRRGGERERQRGKDGQREWKPLVLMLV